MNSPNSDSGRKTVLQPDSIHDGGNARLVGAKDNIKEKLLRAVMQQAMNEIGDSDSIARQAVSSYASEMTHLPAAATRVRELLVQKIADDALRSISDSDNVAREIAESLSIDQSQVRSVVDALRGRLARSIQHAALASLADAQRTANEIARNIPTDGAEMQATVEALRAQLIETVRNEVLRQLQSIDVIVQEIRTALPEDHEALRAIERQLHATLINDVRTHTLSRLKDTAEVAGHIRASLGDTPESVLRIGSQVHSMLTTEAKNRSLELMADSEKVAGEIVSTLGDNPGVVTRAVDIVRNQLIDAIAGQATGHLDNSEEAARQARSRMDTDEQQAAASDRLTDILLREIAGRSVGSISEAEAAADAAYEFVDRHAVELEHVKDLLKARILRDLLRRAVREIGGDAGATAAEMGTEPLHSLADRIAGDEIDAVTAQMLFGGRPLRQPAEDEAVERIAPPDTTFADADTEIRENPDHGVEDDHVASEDAADLEALLSGEGGTTDVVEAVVSDWMPGEPESVSDDSPNNVEEVHAEGPAVPSSEDQGSDAEPDRADEEEVAEDEQPSYDSLSFEATIDEAEPNNDSPEDEHLRGTAAEDQGSDAETDRAAEEEVAEDEQPSYDNLSFEATIDEAVPNDDFPVDERVRGAAAEDQGSDAETDRAAEEEVAEDEEPSYDSLSFEATVEEAEPNDDLPEDGQTAELSAEEAWSTSEPAQAATEHRTEEHPTEEEPAAIADDSWKTLDSFEESDHEEAAEATAGNVVEEQDREANEPDLSHAEESVEPLTEVAAVDSEWMPKPAPAEPVAETPQATEEPASTGIYYLYGIMTVAGEAFDGPVPLGIQSGRVEAVDYDGLRAVVSVVNTDTFSGEALKTNLSSASWLQENVRKHASIIEQLRSRQTLLPMPFCTVLSNRDRILRMLHSNYASYFDALQRVENKQEWVLRIYRNDTTLAARVNESDRRVEGALSEISRGVSGYLREEMNRMEAEHRQDPIALVTEHCAQRSHEALVVLAAEGRKNHDRGGQPRAGESLVLNTAYLVADNADTEMRAEVERLRAEYAELGFRYELTGPWPPYHFVNAEGGQRREVEVES